MTEPLINILIRVSRPILFERCYDSLIEQTYKNWKSIIHYDIEDSKDYCFWTNANVNIFAKDHDKTKPFFYNLFLNDVIAEVKDGWWMVVDDDDKFADKKSLERISKHLVDEDQLVICQMLRNGRPKPADMYMDKKAISRGRIGMPCFLLHSKHKDIARFEATEDADYRFIKAVSEKLKCKFVKEVVVDAGVRGNGEKHLL